MKLRLIAVAMVCASLPGVSWAADAPSAQFNIQQSTMAPGTVLQPGTYSIRVIDHLQDRFLVRVEGSQGSSRSVFIAVPSKTLAGHPGIVDWAAGSGSGSAMRGFVFKQGGPALEFVYPKDEAVSLAKANGKGVLAVDPASEGKAPELAKLSNDEMQVVTLWMLTPERVSPQASEVKISAARYSAASADSGGQAGSQVAANHPAILKRLPHTASALPLVLLLGVMSALCACLLRIRRTAGGVA